MKIVLNCVASIVATALTFIALNWLFSKITWMAIDWQILWFAVICIISVYALKILSKFISVVATFPITAATTLNQFAILKWILLFVGWGLTSFNAINIYYAANFSDTKSFILAISAIIMNCTIPWEMHATIQSAESAKRSGEKKGNDIIITAKKIAKSINDGEMSYEETLAELQLLLNSNIIDNSHFLLLITFIKAEIKPQNALNEKAPEPQYLTPKKGEKTKVIPKGLEGLSKENQAKAILTTMSKYLNKTPEQIKKMQDGNK